MKFCGLGKQRTIERIANITKFRISLRHSACYGVKHDATGELAACELIDVSGYLYHLFTFADHRRKGLANVAELANCKECIRYVQWAKSCD